MQRILKMICTVIGALILIVSSIFLGFHFLQQLVLSEPSIIQRIESPTSEYIAYVFESDGGATSGFVYRLSILRANEKLKKSIGNTYISKDMFDVEWTGEKELKVNNHPNEFIYKQKEKVLDVTIKYQYLKPRN